MKTESNPALTNVAQLRHDLYNVVGNIAGFADMMLEEMPGGSSARLRAHLERIRQTAAVMLEGANASLDPQKTQNLQASDAPLRQLRKQATEILGAVRAISRFSNKDSSGTAFANDLARISASAKEALQLMTDAVAAASNSAAPEPLCAPSDTTLWTSIDDPDDGALSPEHTAGLILVVDDLAANRELLARRLARIGYATHLASSGHAALEAVATHPIDLILLDLMMPDLDGLTVLRRLKQNPLTVGIPVVMLSATDQVDSVVRCIKLGAEDFLPKPFNPVLLLARIQSSLSKKRLRDKETQFLARLQREQDRSERLLLNILPPSVAERLKQGEQNIADSFAEVTVLFSDFVGFTKLSSAIPAKQLVSQLNAVFSAFDHLCAERRLEKIKTIGDSFMAVAGLPDPLAHHAQAAAELALDMQAEVTRHGGAGGERFRMRIGLNSGPVVAGVIGARKFAYDVWGDTVNLASRMEQLAPPGGILVSRATRDLLRKEYRLKARGRQSIKGKGPTPSYLLVGQKSR